MPDIAMCQGVGQASGKSTDIIDCPKKEECYRFKATPSEFRQAFFMYIPYDKVTETCENFVPLSKGPRIERELP
jgi:hypothetical protein